MQRDIFSSTVLKRCTALTALHMDTGRRVGSFYELQDNLEVAPLRELKVPPSLLDLKLTGPVATTVLASALGVLTGLTALELYQTRADATALVFPGSTTSLGKLTLENAKVELTTLQATEHLFELKLGSYVGEKLASATIAWISQLPALERLGLTNYNSWDDLSPLAALQIKHLHSSAGPALALNMLTTGCLGSLVSAALYPNERHLASKTAIKSLEQGLLELPDFKQLSWQAAHGAPWMGRDGIVNAIVQLQKHKWISLYKERYGALYERKD